MLKRVIHCAICLLLLTIGVDVALADGVDIRDEGNGQFVGEARVKDRPAKRIPKRKTSTTTAASTSSAAKPAKPAPPTDEAEWTYEHNCWAQTRGCLVNTSPDKDADTPSRVDPEEVARELVVHLQLPDPTPRFGPDPSVNEWDMTAVGFPLWLWTDGPRQVSTTASRYGISFDLSAKWTSTTFDMGDGHRVTCTETTKYRNTVKPGSKSPTCGYAYAKASKDSYTVTAITHWTISWSALGQSGSFPGSHSGSRDLVVGELQALVVR